MKFDIRVEGVAHACIERLTKYFGSMYILVGTECRPIFGYTARRHFVQDIRECWGRCSRGGFHVENLTANKDLFSYLSSCCVVVTDEMTRHIEEKELIHV